LLPTILIVDDDAEFRSSLAGVLTDGGFRVIAAVDGIEALHVLDSQHASIAAVVVDLNVPHVNGFEVIGALTRRQNLIGILATSAVYNKTYLELALYLGAHLAINKPVRGSADTVGWVAAVRSVIVAEKT
jgi:CheY-like chemotaxis protein